MRCEAWAWIKQPYMKFKYVEIGLTTAELSKESMFKVSFLT